MNDTYPAGRAAPRTAPAEELRTAPPAYQGGRIYPCDPAAVAHLNRLMEEQRRQKEAAQAARQAKSADTAARLLAAARARKAQQQAAAAAEAAAEPVAASPASDPLDDFHVRALHARHAAGESVTDLAAEAGIGRSTLARHFRRLGLEVSRRGRPTGRRGRPTGRPPRGHLSADQLAAAVAAHDAGQLWREIATDLGVSRARLRQLLLAAGHEANRKANRAKYGPATKLGDDAIRALHARWEAGESSVVLAAEAGIDPQTLRRHCRRLALRTPRVYRRLELTADQTLLPAADT